MNKKRPLIIAGVIGAAFIVWLTIGLTIYQNEIRQAITRESADKIQTGMTRAEVEQIVGKPAEPFLSPGGLAVLNDQTTKQLSESGRLSNSIKGAACSQDTDAACCAHYPVKDGTGLRIIYSGGRVAYCSLWMGSTEIWKR